MIRARCTDLRELGRGAAADELDGALGGVDLEDPGPVDGDASAQRRQDLGEEIVPAFTVERGDAPAAERLDSGRLLVDERGRAVDRVERRPVGLLGGFAPADETVLGEQAEPSLRMRRNGL